MNPHLNPSQCKLPCIGHRLSVAENIDQYCAKRAEERHNGISLAANERCLLVPARFCLMVIWGKKAKPAYDETAAVSDLESTHIGKRQMQTPLAFRHILHCCLLLTLSPPCSTFPVFSSCIRWLSSNNITGCNWKLGVCQCWRYP